ncbi:MAG TPA: regulatory iron-sulfur-containing complex subunit RicT [Candidatus Absconditabacterales bacterium]|nr:regulatory iron-sulfur-containing complex subunit RicT [Candidatus Absconditabacterales bacterium]
MSGTIYVLDWLISKHIEVRNARNTEQLKPGDKVIYRVDGEDVDKIGLNVGFFVQTDIVGSFVEHLSGEKEIFFQKKYDEALKLYQLFRKDFRSEFSEAIPVTARFNLQGTTIYFYFYSEQRFQFSDFVRRFRQKIGMNFFLYQVGARDMIRLHPRSKDWLSQCGCGPCGCSGLGPLPSIEMENVVLQNLEGRDVEKLKGRCGKLKCSLVYERDLYIEESKKFPKKGEILKINGKDMTCFSYNIMTGDVVLKSLEGENMFTTITELNLLSGISHNVANTSS